MSDRRLRVMFLCRASTKDGFGHLFRCHSLIEAAPETVDPYLVILGAPNQGFTSRKLSSPEQVITRDEDSIALADEIKPDVLIFDLNNLDANVFSALARGRFTVCLSPLFEHISGVSQVFHRTAFLPKEIQGPQVYAGLDYAITSLNCRPVPDNVYREHLHEPQFSVGISMGGGDAPNNTLEVLRSLLKFPDEAIFWVFLGVGYSHSYDLLVEESHGNQRHEVVLVKTNQSMWRVLMNCHLVILSGGVTSYDAIYAGMPAVNLLQSSGHSFLFRELVEQGVCFCPGVFDSKTLEMLPGFLSDINENRDRLWKMHVDSQKLIDGKGSHRIWQRILEGVRDSL